MTERICQKNKASSPNFRSLFPAVSKRNDVSSREDFICGLLYKWLNMGQSIMVLFGETVLAGFVEVCVSFSHPPLPVLCNVSVYINMTFICFSRIKKLLIERHRVHGLQPLKGQRQLKGQARLDVALCQQVAAPLAISLRRKKPRNFSILLLQGRPYHQ